jgi:uncharacterized metal-binding protein
MPSGQTHDRLTVQTSLLLIPATLIATIGQPIVTTLATSAIAALSCAVSGIWISPDVDSSGYLKKRYGAFRLVWKPYYKLCHAGGHYRVNGKGTHRSHRSHTPILGSLSRAAYLSLPLLLTNPGLFGVIQSHPRLFLAVAIGLEVGSMVHILSDWIWSELR